MIRENEDNTELQCRLRKVNPVVNRDGPVCPNTVYVTKNRPCTFGRSTGNGVNAQLVSRTTPLMISRKHSTVAYGDGKWTITDHESLNGVYVNGIKIKASSSYPLLSGDKVVFGRALVGSQSAEFEYVFQEIPVTNQLKRSRNDPNIEMACERKRKREEEESRKNETKAVQLQREIVFEEQIKLQEDRIKQLSSELTIKEEAHNDLAVTLEKKEHDLAEQLEQQREQLQLEKLEAEKKLQNLLEQQLIEKECMLKENFDEKIRALEHERSEVEKSLQKELSDKLSEKDETYREELEKQKETLNRILSEMETERQNREIEMLKNQELLNNLKSAEENEKHLGSCLEELRRQIQEKEQDLKRQEEITKKAEEDGKRCVLQQMEDEFTCMICHELFVHAVTLACAHSFCEMCLRSWMKRKKECPVCRNRITGRAVKSVVLDSAISKMIENGDSDTKQNRARLIAQRNALREAEQANGFQKLLVSDPDDTEHASPNRRDSRGGHRQGPSRDAQGHSREPHWNNNRQGHGDQRHNNFIPRSVQGAHTNEVFSNRYNSVTSSILGQGQMGHNPQVSHSRNVGEHGVGQSFGSGQNNQASGVGRDGRRHQASGGRNAGPPVPSSHPVRAFNGHCFICGNFGHAARNCFYNTNHV